MVFEYNLISLIWSTYTSINIDYSSFHAIVPCIQLKSTMITQITLEVPNRFPFVFVTLEVLAEASYEAKLYSTTF